MNYSKVKVLILSLFVCLVSCFYGCDKKNKLANNTMILQIDPPVDINLEIGFTKELKAIIRNSEKEEVDEPVVWSVSPVELGEFTSTTSKTVTFLAKSHGKGRIYLSCQGIVTSLNVEVS